MKRGLSRAPARRIGRIGVEPVFNHVVIDGRQLHGGELADLLIHHVEFMCIVGGSDFSFQPGELHQDPAVQAGEFLIRHGVLRRIEVVKIRELIAQGVADHAIAFSHLVDPLIADDDVVPEILRGNPESNDISAVFFDVGLGGLRFLVNRLPLLAFGDFLTIGIDHEAVGEHTLVRRRSIAHQREQQRRLEPATMLITAFNVNVRLPSPECGTAGNGVGRHLSNASSR